jgi:hypothetical protein
MEALLVRRYCKNLRSRAAFRISSAYPWLQMVKAENVQGVNTLYYSEEWRGKHRISPLGYNLTPRGQNSPLGSKFAPRGKVKNGSQGGQMCCEKVAKWPPKIDQNESPPISWQI